MSTADADANATARPRFRLPRLTVGAIGTGLFLFIALPCFLSLFIALGTPIGADKGVRYNDLRYDDTVLGTQVQHQRPGTVTYKRTVAPPAGAPEGTEAEEQVYRSFELLGTDESGRSLLIRCLLGGAISLGVGISAALMAVFIGVTWGATAGYLGGRTDSVMMRIVDVLYGLPYLLLVVLLSVAVGGVVDKVASGFVGVPAWVASLWATSPWLYGVTGLGALLVLLGLCAYLFWVLKFVSQSSAGFLELLAFSMRLILVLIATATVFAALWFVANAFLLPALIQDPDGSFKVPVPEWIVGLVTGYPLLINLLTLVVAIGGVSWLTMARVIRGQVLSLRGQPFIEAARAQGMGAGRIIRVHLLPNLVGPIVVYTTLAVPQAILQESFLSFLGIGVNEPLPSWGQLASVGIKELPALALPKLNDQFHWWLLVFPCLLLGLTLLSLNFMGDAMRERFDPRSKRRG